MPYEFRRILSDCGLIFVLAFLGHRYGAMFPPDDIVGNTIVATIAFAVAVCWKITEHVLFEPRQPPPETSHSTRGILYEVQALKGQRGSLYMPR